MQFAFLSAQSRPNFDSVQFQEIANFYQPQRQIVAVAIEMKQDLRVYLNTQLTATSARKKRQSWIN